MNNPWNTEQPWDVPNLWVKSEPIVRSMTRKRTGSADLSWTDYLCQQFLWPALTGWSARVGAAARGQAWQFSRTRPPSEYRCLVLGSTEAEVEKSLWDWGFAGEIVVSEVADKVLARTRALAEKLGQGRTRFVIADLNEHRFDGKFDFIVANGVLHHIREISHCLAGLASCLAPEGLLFASEFTGPFRFLLPKAQLEWINGVLAMAPSFLRLGGGEGAGPLPPGQHWANPYRPRSEAEMLQIDPTEAVAGHVLDGLLRHHFEIVEYARLGGTLTTWLHEQIDYRKTNEGPGRAWIEALLELEDRLIESGTLNCDYAFYVGRAR